MRSFLFLLLISFSFPAFTYADHDDQIAEFDRAFTIAKAAVECLEGDQSWVAFCDVWWNAANPVWSPDYTYVQGKLVVCKDRIESINQRLESISNAYFPVTAWSQQRDNVCEELSDIVDAVIMGYDRQEWSFNYLQNHEHPVLNQAERVRVSPMIPYDEMNSKELANEADRLRRFLEEQWED